MYVPIDVSAQLYATLYTVTLKFYLKKAPGIGTTTCIQWILPTEPKIKGAVEIFGNFYQKIQGHV